MLRVLEGGVVVGRGATERIEIESESETRGTPERMAT
jgi:hypothetical protein